MKKANQGFVQVPTQTLNALKNMLFSSEKGVDLSAIVSDLCPSANEHDITAINVALTYKGVRINVDERPHYQHDWRNRFYRYDYKGYSLILGVVKATYTICELDENGEIQEICQSDNVGCYGFQQWDEFTTDIDDIIKIIADKK